MTTDPSSASASTASKFEGFTFKEQTVTVPAAVTYWGDVKDVISGTCRDEIFNKEISAESFRWGFELGASRDERTCKEGLPIPKKTIGECVCGLGMTYTRACDKENEELYYTTHHGPSLQTMGLAMVGPKDATPEYILEGEGDVSWDELISWMTRKVDGTPVTYAGVVEFQDMVVTACALPPIGGENIFENKAKFYPTELAGPHTVPRPTVIAHGFCADMDRIRDTPIFEPISRVLYDKPKEWQLGTEELNVHTHVVTTDPQGDEFYKSLSTGTPYVPMDAAVLPDKPLAADVYHLCSANVKRVRLEVYPVRSMVPHSAFMGESSEGELLAGDEIKN